MPKFKLNFSSKKLPAFGLDVSSGSVKLLQLSRHGADLSVQAYASVVSPKGMIINDAIADVKTFNFLLKQSLDKPQFGRLNTRYVVASLPESKSFVRVIQIPQMSESEAENAVPYEAENFIPMPLDQVYLDWQKIGQAGDKMSVLMIATPKDFVDSYLSVLDKAGLSPVALEVESQSCLRAALPNASQETCLLLDMESFRTSLIMAEQGNLQFTSTIPIAGNSLTESLAKALGIASAKAEEIKKKVGLNNTAEYPNIRSNLLPVLNVLIAEIKNILKFHSEHSDKQVERVVLCGGGARLNNLAEFLAQNLAEAGVIKVETAKPWQNLPKISAPPLDESTSLSFVTAIGLALRGVDHEVE